MASTTFRGLVTYCTRIVQAKITEILWQHQKTLPWSRCKQEGNWHALLQSVHEDFESEADGCQQNQVETNVNDCEKNIIPDDLLPVACSSKTLTDAESGNANMEHELLGVVARVEKFYTFCYGRYNHCSIWPQATNIHCNKRPGQCTTCCGIKVLGLKAHSVT